MPLTAFQGEVLRLVGAALPADGYLAGGAAIHFEPSSARYSKDLDLFHDTVQGVATSFAAGAGALQAAGYVVDVQLSQPGFIRAMVSNASGATLVDWSHDTAWRFMLLQASPLGGWLLHPVDLAINKVLALVGRDEPRDFVDILYLTRTLLPLGPMVWAAAGKDPGFTPHLLLDLLKRRGHHRPDAFNRLDLVEPWDVMAAKREWLDALESAETFLSKQPPDELGALYWSHKKHQFVDPTVSPDSVPHYGQPGGIIPKVHD